MHINISAIPLTRAAIWDMMKQEATSRLSVLLPKLWASQAYQKISALLTRTISVCKPYLSDRSPLVVGGSIAIIAIMISVRYTTQKHTKNDKDLKNSIPPICNAAQDFTISKIHSSVVSIIPGNSVDKSLVIEHPLNIISIPATQKGSVAPYSRRLNLMPASNHLSSIVAEQHKLIGQQQTQLSKFRRDIIGKSPISTRHMATSPYKEERQVSRLKIEGLEDTNPTLVKLSRRSLIPIHASYFSRVKKSPHNRVSARPNPHRNSIASYPSATSQLPCKLKPKNRSKENPSTPIVPLVLI